MTISSIEDSIARRLRERGLRMTESRRRVLEVLLDAGSPLTLPQILRADDGLSQSSAYRNLSELRHARVVHRIDAADDHSHYELADDLTAHHHHLVCNDCGRVQDVELDHAIEDLLDRDGLRLGQAVGFEVTGHRLDLVGTCAECDRT